MPNGFESVRSIDNCGDRVLEHHEELGNTENVHAGSRDPTDEGNHEDGPERFLGNGHALHVLHLQLSGSKFIRRNLLNNDGSGLVVESRWHMWYHGFTVAAWRNRKLPPRSRARLACGLF